MRFYVDVSASAGELPWKYVHGAAHAVVYTVLGADAPKLAEQLHEHGWAETSLRPLGVSPPVFSGAPRKPSVYATSGRGRLWFGSPIPELAAALLAGVTRRERLQWGPLTLTVEGTKLEVPAEPVDSALLTCCTPVLVKADGGRYVLPQETGFVEALSANTQRKADLLGLPGDVDLEVVTSGPRRAYEVSGGTRFGATATLRIHADPRLIAALREWGLGMGNIQGFGWVR
ncbi:MAG: CRISPR-associated endoribonuclease Cas6 [Micromonosporaceae bacterium]|nr:CRISPR-associated endoribonuclease Cas6 [Micromonosporaceae bacterium]